MKYLIEIMEKGGEGIIIRKYESKYEKGRSSSLQKVKPQFLSIGTVTKSQSIKNTIQIKSINELEFGLYKQVSELKYGDIIKERKIEFKFNSISKYGIPRTPIINQALPNNKEKEFDPDEK